MSDRRPTAASRRSTSARPAAGSCSAGSGPDVLRADRGQPVPQRPGRGCPTACTGTSWACTRTSSTACAAAVRQTGALAGIGIDSWAVDYGLLDARRGAARQPAHYRDARTDGGDRDGAPADRPAASCTPSTACSHCRSTRSTSSPPSPTLHDPAHRLLLIPDLLGYWLTGQRGRRGDQRLHHRPARRPHRALGAGAGRGARPARRAAARGRPPRGRSWRRCRPSVREELGTDQEPLRHHGRLARHRLRGRRRARHGPDASPTSPAAPGRWSASSSTRRCSPRTAGAANFTNERGVDGTIRYLRNVMGLWLLSESIRVVEPARRRARPAGSARRGRRPAAAARGSTRPTRSSSRRATCRARIAAGLPRRGGAGAADPARDRPVHPRQPRGRVRRRRSTRPSGSPASRSRSCTSSAADRRTRCCASSPPTPAGCPVVAGPVEATALGNLLVQARTHGVLAGDLSGPAGADPPDGHADPVRAARAGPLTAASSTGCFAGPARRCFDGSVLIDPTDGSEIPPMAETLQLDPAKTAVVLIEYQNDFTSEGGVLHGAVAEVMDKTGMLDNTQALVDAARAAGATVMHAPITFAEGYDEITEHPYGILKGVVDGNAFVKGTLGRGDRRRPRAQPRRHRHRGQARPRHLRQHEPRLHPAQQGHQDRGPRRLPHQLLRRVDDAQRVRERLPGDHADRLRGRDLGRGARQRDHATTTRCSRCRSSRAR